MTPEWLIYSNQGATRNQPIDPRLVSALGFLPELGLTMEVFSGGQPAAGGGPRVGSTRHDHGGAADVFFLKDGQRLDWNNPAHLPYFQEVVKRGKAAGITGFGAGDGYMQPGSMHIGFGNPGVWGAGGKGANAAKWLTEAYGGAPAGATPNGNTLAFGPGVTGQNPIADMFALAGDPSGLAMGTEVETGLGDVLAPKAPRAVAQAVEQKKEDDRRQAIFANVGSWFG